jgi:hypothetical protein
MAFSVKSISYFFPKTVQKGQKMSRKVLVNHLPPPCVIFIDTVAKVRYVARWIYERTSQVIGLNVVYLLMFNRLDTNMCVCDVLFKWTLRPLLHFNAVFLNF